LRNLISQHFRSTGKIPTARRANQSGDQIYVRKDDYVAIYTLLLCELDDGPKFAGHGDSASPDGHAAGPDRETTG
jgi:hypothetical protein